MHGCTEEVERGKEEQVKETRMANHTDGAGAWIVMLIIGWFAFDGIETVWHSKTRYSVQYGVDSAHVIKDKKPHDCDWLAAPLGNKNCHYDVESRKETVITGTDKATGRPIVSYDEGNIWSWNDGNYPAKAASDVFVTWKKIED
jgi:hypothetical protein